jgi:hypothetical protein
LLGGGGEAFAAADAFEEEFGYIFDGDVFGVGFAGSTAEHALAEGATYCEDLFSCGRRKGLLGFAEAIVGDTTVTLLFLLPELRSASAAAEGVFAIAREFGSGVAEDVEEVAGGFVDAVVTAEVTRVVVGDGRFGWRRCEFLVGYESFKVFGVMHDLVVATDLFVLVADGVHAVRAASDHELGLYGVQGGDVFVG